MLKIAVCDDTAEEREEVAGFAGAFFEDRRIPAHIDTYETGDQLLVTEKDYDICLLDVIMPGTGGIETAERLGRQKKRPAVIFITSSLESAVDGYRVEAAGFILKPVREENFRDTMGRVLERHVKCESPAITVVHNRVPIEVKLERVLLFENKLHRVYVTLEDGQMFTIHQKLSELQPLLDAHSRFLRCHQSYIVNLDYVEKLEDSCFFMAGGKLIPISRNFYKQSKNAYYHYRLK